MEIKCSFTDLAPIVKLVPHPRNTNTHPEKQIKMLAKIIKHHGWRHPIIVSKKSGFIVAGHGRLEAAKILDLETVPVDYQEFENEADEFQFLVADNKIAELAEHDDKKMMCEIQDLGIEDIDFELLGLSDLNFDPFENLDQQLNSEEVYTRKIESPIYEPTGEKPSLSDLYDLSKTLELHKEIDRSSLSLDEKNFLKAAAYRHAKFNYKNIAEYYAHSHQQIKDLIENSAMVIIDYDKAIELGFVKLTEDMRQAYENDYPIE